ncbi:MAG TPA: filamin/ABP280 repeat domain-containing protein [Fimbriiglobus sp.]|nr:filamin/ABP280 repeat domain-containing protein [Fimbriiglobus sp.]
MSATDVFLSANPAVAVADGAIALLVLASVLQLLLTAVTAWQALFGRGASLLTFVARTLLLGLGTVLLLVVLLALGAVVGDYATPIFYGLLVVGLTLWTYRAHAQATRRRVLVILGLRLAALLVVLIAAVRPSVGVRENPKVPSVLLIGVDMSESMTVPDELGDRPRIEAVRKVLERCQPILEELQREQNVTVVMYGFGPADFDEAVNRYDPAAPAKYNRSDYATYLRKTFDRWQGERFLRGHIVIGDGAHNGDTYPGPEAARWRQTGRSVHTFAVGTTDILPDSKDVAITSVGVTSGSPDAAVFVKTEFTLRAVVNAYGFQGAVLPIHVEFDAGDGYKTVPNGVQQVTLAKDRDNEVELKLNAPDKPGEYKVRVSIPVERTPGDVAPSNNVVETYLTVTKEGMRVLLVGRLGWEEKFIRRALQADPRIDLYQVLRQTTDPPPPRMREDFDFDSRAYDVIILGDVSARHLQTIDPKLPAKIAEQVKQKGVGLLMTGGPYTFLGTPGVPDATGWRGTREIEDILPVDLNATPPVPAAFFESRNARYQFVPTAETFGHYLTRLGATDDESKALWQRLNDWDNRSRFTGLSKIGMPLLSATVYAVASDRRVTETIPAAPGVAAKLAPVLVGHQIGVGSRGRVLVLAAYETYMWQRLGQPKTDDGLQLHARFWRQLVRWLAHQEQDDAAAFARVLAKRLPVGGKQTVRVGLRSPGGAPAKDPQFTVKVLAPGQDENSAQPRTIVPDPDGGFQVTYNPTAPGEYTVKVAAVGKDKDGKEVKGEASARFQAYPEASDEMLRKAADHDMLRKIAAAGGGQFHRLDELPAFLKELAAQPLETVKPKPKYLPDWRRDRSKGFLPGWLILFALLLGGEWALRRTWGLV